MLEEFRYLGALFLGKGRMERLTEASFSVVRALLRSIVVKKK